MKTRHRRHHVVLEMMCRHCHRLFAPRKRGDQLCSYFCPPRVFFEGEPTKNGCDMTEEEKHNLVMQYAPLAWQQASRRYHGHPYAWLSMELVDLYQAATIGLIVAAERFKTTGGAKFMTYAHWWIRNYLRRTSHDRLVSVPEYIWTGGKAEKKDYTALAEVLNRTFPYEFPQMNRHEAENEGEQVDPPALKANEIDFLEVELLQEKMKQLKSRDREVLARRYGLYKGQAKQTLDEVGKVMGITRERVRQLENKATRLLKNWLAGAEECRHKPAEGQNPCFRVIIKDGYCHMHHPANRLAKLQRRMEIAYDKADASGDWSAYALMEGKEVVLLGIVKALEQDEDDNTVSGAATEEQRSLLGHAAEGDGGGCVQGSS
jgi:RNA polymerase sigma factor (sigma-70 family)